MLYRNYAVTIARTGDDIIFLRNTDDDARLIAEIQRDAGNLDATTYIATGSVVKSRTPRYRYPVVDYVRREA